MQPPPAAAAEGAGLVPATKYRSAAQELALLTCLHKVHKGEGRLEALATYMRVEYADM
jgi:hypothetical protein